MLNILLIENSIPYQKAITKFIQKEMIFVNIEAVDNYEKLKKINLENIDLVICDCDLPDSDKEEHIKFLLDKHKKIIVLTKKENIQSIYRDKVLDFIYKNDLNTFSFLTQLIKRFNKNKYKKVLVVDDSIIVRKEVSRYLKLFNLEVLEAKNGKAAKDIILSENISLVISDILMPVMDGFDLIRSIRKNKSFEELPILAMSGVHNSFKAVKILKYGANDFIKKPFSKEELLIRVGNLLNLYDFINQNNKEAKIDSLTKAYDKSILENKIDSLFYIYDKKTVVRIKIKNLRNLNNSLKEEVLVFIADNLRKRIRKNDFLIRYDQDEFLIFMPNTLKEEANIIQKIKNIQLDNNIELIINSSDEGETLAEMIKNACK